MRQEKNVEYLYAKKQAIAPKALAAEFLSGPWLMISSG